MKYEEIVVIFDFDGTITTEDTLDKLFGKYANQVIYEQRAKDWMDEKIGSNKCLKDIFDTVSISNNQMVGFIDSLQLRPGFKALMRDFLSYDVPAYILSDGVDLIIDEVLKEYSEVFEVVYSNKSIHREDGTIHFESRNSNRCLHSPLTCAHCKPQTVREIRKRYPTKKIIYIGDGRSDYTASLECDFVFATGSLYSFLKRSQQVSFSGFQNFNDVGRIIKSIDV